MSSRIDLPKEELYQKYIIENLSQQKVADYFNVSVDTIKRNLKMYNISSHTNKDWMTNEPIQLTQRQQEIINGALLCDGSIVKPKKGLNAYFSYLSKSEEHVRAVCTELEDYVSPGFYYKYEEIYDKRTDKSYSRYSFRTLTNPTFTELYNMWYKNNIKIVPKNLILTPLTCLIWYLGDGELAQSSTRASGYILLCTDSFIKEDIEKYLLPQLSNFSATLVEHGYNKYRIYIPRIKVKEFLEYIGPCPVEDYQHKWNIQEYKRKPLCYEPEIEKQIIQAYEDGCSPGTIANYFQRDRTTILSCLKRYGLDTNKNKFSNKKVVIRNEE